MYYYTQKSGIGGKSGLAVIENGSSDTYKVKIYIVSCCIFYLTAATSQSKSDIILPDFG